jgi:beta-glucosidase-like glycosyl hydrolase
VNGPTKTLLAAMLASCALPVVAQTPLPESLDKAAARWVEDTFKRMTLDDKVGQLVVSSLHSTYLASDTDVFDALADKVKRLRLGGFHVFGGREPVPNLLLGGGYGSVILGQPLAVASTLNRLQSLSALPLLTTADLEAGLGFRVSGATVFSRAMAIGAADDDRLAYEAGRITAIEARALGVHLNFAPVADVNNNPRNPVINTRAFGERPEVVGRLASAYVRGLHAGGMLATLKHFPGHGDTDVDSHLGLPVIQHPRDRLESMELVPFRAALAAGADAVMSAHVQLPALDAAEFSPATLSRPIISGLLRDELKFDGLVVTDSMGMDAVARRLSPGDAAAAAISAGNDIVLHSPDDAAAVAAIRAAVMSGTISAVQLDASVRRILRAKARLGLHRTRLVPLDGVPKAVGGRTNGAVARALSARSITLIKDDRNQVPLRVPREAAVLYLSLLDYPAGWRIAAPGRTFLPELRARWPGVTAIELSDRSSPSEIDLVRASAPRYDAIVAAVFVRAASGSGRMDLATPLLTLLSDLARSTENSPRPFITVFFGNPYVAAAVPTLPAMMLTYDFYDLAELSALQALVGETGIVGRLPIALPGLFDAGFGLMR